MTRPRFQFTLTHAFVAVAVLGALFVVVAAAGFERVALAGFEGVALLGCALGITMYALGVASRDGRCLAVGGLLTLAFGLMCTLDMRTAIGVGRSTLPCTVQVTDSRGDPMPAANVRIRDISIHGYPEGRPVRPMPVGEPGVSGVTDGSGTVTLAFEFRNFSRSGPFVDTAHVYVSPYLWVQVEMPGYRRELVRLDTFTGNNYDWNQLPLPRINIQLTRPVPRDGA